MKPYLTILVYLLFIQFNAAQNRYLTKEGRISFYSKAPIEDIEAQNNQVLSLIDLDKGEISIQLLIKSFLFEKALMREHFNENYMESHKFPKAYFKGSFELLAPLGDLGSEIELKGTLKIRNIERQVVIITKIKHSGNEVLLSGAFAVEVSDFDIKIPMSVINNIAKEVEIRFELNHKPYKR